MLKAEEFSFYKDLKEEERRLVRENLREYTFSRGAQVYNGEVYGAFVCGKREAACLYSFGDGARDHAVQNYGRRDLSVQRILRVARGQFRRICRSGNAGAAFADPRGDL